MTFLSVVSRVWSAVGFLTGLGAVSFFPLNNSVNALLAMCLAENLPTSGGVRVGACGDAAVDALGASVSGVDASGAWAIAAVCVGVGGACASGGAAWCVVVTHCGYSCT